MSDLNNVINKIINKEKDFCCLCFDASQNVAYFDDEVIYHENYDQNNIKLSEVISCVLGNEMFSNLECFEAICTQCATAAIDSFRFMKQSRENYKRMVNMIDLLNGSIETIPESLDGLQTLFVSLNPELHITNQYYYNMECKDPQSALDVYYSISQPKIKIKKEIEYSKDPQIVKERRKYTVKKERKYKFKIPTEEMLHNRDRANIQCKKCLNTFTTVSSLRTHFMRMHAPKDFKCDVCLKGFSSSSLLSTHKLEAHNSGLMCTECGKVFNNRNTLNMHEKNHYLRLVCQECGRMYRNHNTYKNHIENNVCGSSTRRRPADAKFECDHCHKKYSQKTTLRVHIQYEHGNYKYLNCKWCNKKFWCKSRLNAHIVKHTKERNYMCEICNGKFVTKESLLYHTRIHTGEKPYKCPHCDCRFLNSSRRAQHVKSQHMDAIVECDICQAKFKSYHYLLKHKRWHKEVEKEQQEAQDTSSFEVNMIKDEYVEITEKTNSPKVVVLNSDSNILENIELQSNTNKTEYVFEYRDSSGQLSRLEGQKMYFKIDAE